MSFSGPTHLNQPGVGQAGPAPRALPFEKGAALEVFPFYNVDMKHEFSNKTSISSMDLFLKKALKGHEYSKIPLMAEGSERRYTRIVLKSSPSWILACSPLKQQKYFLCRQADFLKAGLNVPQLHPFHQTLNPKEQGVTLSPPSKKTEAHSAQKGLLLIEDLGDQSLEKEVLEQARFPYHYYFQALNQLTQLQKTQSFFQAGLAPRPWKEQDFLQEMLYTEKYLIQKFLKYTLAKKERSDLLKEWSEIAQKLAGFPVYLGHRDFHSRNLFIKNKKIYMIDFQDAGFFPRFYDIASLVYDVYVHTKLKATHRQKLLTDFISKSFILGSAGEWEEEMALTALQRLFQAVGRFAGFYCLKNQKTHLKFIRPGLKMQEELLKTRLLKGKKDVFYPHFLRLIQKLLQK